MAKARSNRRRRYAAPIGGAFILLALVGLAAVVLLSVNLTGRILDNRDELARLENLVRPVVMWDPPPFENPADLNPDTLLFFSMWAALLDENANYSANENTEITVPASDLDVMAARLFGPGLTLEHRTFGEYEQSYFFDTARQVYHVPVNVQLFLYSPRVVSIERVGEYYEARVGYIPPRGAFTANLQGNREDPDADKYMIYLMRRVGDTFQIVALRDDPALGDATHWTGR